MIRTIVLDIGMVLVDFPWKEYVKSFGFSSEKEEKIVRAVFENPDWNEFDRGVLTDEEILRLFCQNAPDCQREIHSMFAGPIEQLIAEYPFAADWVQELKAAGYQVLLLSNFGDTLFNRVDFQFLPYVDGGIISYRVKCIKPDPQIYHILMKEYGLTGEEILFLDDNPANIKAAQAEGWNTIWSPDHKAALEGLEAYGIVCQAGRE